MCKITAALPLSLTEDWADVSLSILKTLHEDVATFGRW